MDQRRHRKHLAHKRAVVIVNEHRPYVESTPGGAAAETKLDRAVADESNGFADQENRQFERDSAADRVDKSRRALHTAVRHFATVSAVVASAGGASTTFDPSRPLNDEQLIGRVEAIHAVASADPDVFVKGGVQPTGLDALAAELAAFKSAKDTMTLAGKQHTEATARFDQALDQGDEAIAVIEGILATSPDAPVGALEALRQAKRIGPRIKNGEPVTTTPPATTSTPATPSTGSAPTEKTVDTADSTSSGRP